MHREDDQRKEPILGSDAESIPADASDRLAQQERERRARVTKVVVGLILLGILITFVSTNLGSTKVHFVFFSSNAPLIWVMLGCAIVGGVVGFLVGRPGRQIGRDRGRRKD
jgi:uncharacterized integral membrane protein